DDQQRAADHPQGAYGRRRRLERRETEREAQQDREQREVGAEHDLQTPDEAAPRRLREDQQLHRAGSQAERESEGDGAEDARAGRHASAGSRSSSTVIVPSSARVISSPSHSRIGSTVAPVRPRAARSTSGVWLIARPIPSSGTWSSNARTPA